MLAAVRARRALRSGRALEATLDLQGALAQYAAAFAASPLPEVCEAYYGLLLRRKDLETALTVCRAAPRDGRWRSATIRVLGGLGRWQECESECRAVVSAASTPTERGAALVTLCWCLRNRGPASRDAAVAAGREAVAVLAPALGERHPDVAWARAGLASALLRAGDAASAAAELETARATWRMIGRSDLATAAEDRLLDVLLVSERIPEALALSEGRLASRLPLTPAAARDRVRRLLDFERHAFLLAMTGRGSEAARFETRAGHLRRLVEAEPSRLDGAAEEVGGPLFRTDVEVLSVMPFAGARAAC